MVTRGEALCCACCIFRCSSEDLQLHFVTFFDFTAPCCYSMPAMTLLPQKLVDCLSSVSVGVNGIIKFLGCTQRFLKQLILKMQYLKNSRILTAISHNSERHKWHHWSCQFQLHLNNSPHNHVWYQQGVSERACATFDGKFVLVYLWCLWFITTVTPECIWMLCRLQNIQFDVLNQQQATKGGRWYQYLHRIEFSYFCDSHLLAEYSVHQGNFVPIMGHKSLGSGGLCFWSS